jgi:hypothetical protein
LSCSRRSRPGSSGPQSCSILTPLPSHRLVILDELGYLPFAQSGGQLLFHLVSRLYERTSVIVSYCSSLRHIGGPLCRWSLCRGLGSPWSGRLGEGDRGEPLAWFMVEDGWVSHR